MTEYNGWTNRETWTAHLWISNDQGLYESARERLIYEVKTGALGPVLKEWWDELTDPEEGLMSAQTIWRMVRDIGDEDEINWQEIAEALVEE